MLMASGVRFKCLQRSSLSTLSMVTRLDSIVPSDAELDEARRIVGDFNAKGRARGMAKTKCWLESSATPEERAILQALRGDQRHEYMRRFLVCQISDKEAHKQCVSSRTHSNQRAKCETMHQWSYAAIELWLGLRAARSKVSPVLSLSSKRNKVSRSISAATNACEVDVQRWLQQIQQRIQAKSLNSSRVGGSVHVNAEQVSRFVCKLVWSTIFLTIRWIGPVGAFRRNKSCARFPATLLAQRQP